MKQTGYVTEIKDGKMRVRVDRESACGGNCVSCKGCPTGAVIAEYDVPDGVKVGDTVELTMPNSEFYKKAMLGYTVPTVLTIAGAVVGFWVSRNDGGSVIGAAAGLALGLILARIFAPKKN